MKINLLGSFQAMVDGQELRDFANRKGQALLTYLAVESARAHSRESLATLLWARTGDDRARHNLRQSLGKIRGSLGDIIVSENDCLQLDQDVCATDVSEFEALINGGTDELRRALALYRGELLQDSEIRERAFSDWLAVTRTRLKQKACAAAEVLAANLESAGALDDADDVLDRLLELDPAHEPAHRQLIRMLATRGRRAEALRQYQRCVEALSRELGTKPDAETEALGRELRDNPTVAHTTRQHDGTGSTSLGRAPAVAILPFENLSGDDNRYFVDGIVEDLTTALSGFHSLVVIARGSSFRYRAAQIPERTIARELGAQYLVGGSVQRAGKNVRVNVQLTDAEAGLQVWGHRYDREMEDVFVLQDEITSTLVCTLAGRVEAARLNYARKAAPERLDAYDLLLRGKDHHHRFTAKDCAICIDMFRHAIKRDPDYAVAHAWLACGTGQAMVFGLDDIARLVDQSQAAAERGLELDENESECHRILAQVQLTRRNLERALWHQERALFLNPNDDRVVCAQGEILAFVGRAEEAETWVRRSMRLNPYHPERYWTHLARALYHQSKLEETLAALDSIGRPRIDDRVYRIAALQELGDMTARDVAVSDLEISTPDFDANEFIRTSPYTDDALRQSLGDSLLAALRR